MALLEMIEQKAFLGQEFATWLWFHSEQEEGGITLPDKREVEVDVLKDITLASEAGEALASALKGDAPSLAPEAATALQTGKIVKKMRIRLACGHDEWEFVLQADTLDWSGLKIDVPPSLPFYEAVPLRLRALESFHQLFDDLYQYFLDLRLAPAKWKKEKQAMSKWVAEKMRGPEEEEG